MKRGDSDSCLCPGRSNKNTVNANRFRVRVEPRTRIISNSPTDTVSVCGCISEHFIWMKFLLEATSDHTLDPGHAAPAPFKSYQGDLLNWPWGSLHWQSASFYHCGWPLRQGCCEKSCINWRAWQQWNALSSQRICTFVQLPRTWLNPPSLRRHTPLASCFPDNYCYSLTECRQRMGEAEQRWCKETEGLEKRQTGILYPAEDWRKEWIKKGDGPGWTPPLRSGNSCCFKPRFIPLPLLLVIPQIPSSPFFLSSPLLTKKAPS